ncbi:MAG: NHLP bacteriocin system secretion protein [Eubacteriales bacterium]|nr:NHLP bacteriocin system secretion protein [Eubacteriales bacterium]
MANVFRKTSLDRLSSPEQLDRLITVTSPRIWLTLITIGIVLGCGILWGIFGTIPVKVDTSGILISSGGVSSISSTVSGQITDVRVDNGDEIKKGDTIAIIGEDDIVTEINKTNEIIEVLETLTSSSNWSSVDIPTELLELQQLGLQIQSASNAASYERVNPEVAKREYESYIQLYEAGAVSKAELDQKYSVYMSAQSGYSQQALSASQAVARFNTTKESKLDELTKKVEDLISSMKSDYKIVAPSEGKIAAVKVKRGDMTNPGTVIATLAKTGSNVKALEAVIYVPVSDGKKIVEGMEVKIYPSTVQKEEYGYMIGTVVEVPDYPVSRETVMMTLGNESLVQELTGEGAPLEVRVDLVADDTTVSGYAWSGKKGATVNVQNGTLCSAAVVVAEQRPISMVIPILKQKFLPIE